MTIAEKVPNWALVMASQVAADATVTVSPRAAACCASADEAPPFTLVDKISTVPESDAFAGAAATAALTAVSAAAPTAAAVTGTSAVPATSTGPIVAATTRRVRGHAGRANRPVPIAVPRDRARLAEAIRPEEASPFSSRCPDLYLYEQ